MPSVSPTTLLISSLCLGLVVLTAVLVLSRTVPVSVAFAALAAYAPFALVAGRVVVGVQYGGVAERRDT